MAKKPTSSPGRTEDELAQAVDRMTDMLSTVYDLLARFKDDFTWVINNREEFLSRHPEPAAQPATAPSQPIISTMPPEIIACSDCDVPSPVSLAAALQEGWTELAPHRGEHWNYVGLCPDCLESEYSSEPPPRKTTAADLVDEYCEEPEHPNDTLF